jgi:glycosyltransferase involved in cell wall biosynthesis
MGGGLRREEVTEALREIDLLVVPSVWFENSPLTIHEARATRTPLAVSDFGGMAELVEPGCDGWRFDTGRASSLAGVLEDVLREPALLSQLTFAGEPVKDMRASAAEMEERYTALLESRP